MNTKPAFTLLEMTIVLVILAITTVIVAAAFPGVFAKARLTQSMNLLRADLVRGQIEAQQRGVVGVLEIGADARGYAVTVPPRLSVQRSLPSGVEFAQETRRVEFYPNGRIAPAILTLRSDERETLLVIDPFTGRLVPTGDGARRGRPRLVRIQRRRRDVPLHTRGVEARLRRRRTPARGSDAGEAASARGPCRLAAADAVDNLHGRRRDAAPGFGDLRDEPGGRIGQTTTLEIRGPRTATSQPAMTLVEMTAALAVFGLIMALALPLTTDWLKKSRGVEGQVAATQGDILIADALRIAAQGAVDPASVQVSPRDASWTAIIPDVSPRAIRLRLTIDGDVTTSRLHVVAGDVASVPVRVAGDLRFRAVRTGDALAIIVEAQRGAGWSPIAVETISANAALACAFDMVSRTCR